MVELTAERARVFRITHLDNVPWILAHGLHCKNSEMQAPDFIQIGNPELILKRCGRAVPVGEGGSLDDYVPFYFTPFSPMLYNIKTGWQGITKRPMRDIVILTSSAHALMEHGVSYVFTDRHAYLQTAQFSDDPEDLAGFIDWEILRKRDFKRDPNDPAKFERYQAELLARTSVPVQALTGIVCHDSERLAQLLEMVQVAGVDLGVASRPNWFF